VSILDKASKQAYCPVAKWKVLCKASAYRQISNVVARLMGWEYFFGGVALFGVARKLASEGEVGIWDLRGGGAYVVAIEK
jgi:hypothetical protein